MSSRIIRLCAESEMCQMCQMCQMCEEDAWRTVYKIAHTLNTRPLILQRFNLFKACSATSAAMAT